MHLVSFLGAACTAGIYFAFKMGNSLLKLLHMLWNLWAHCPWQSDSISKMHLSFSVFVAADWESEFKYRFLVFSTMDIKFFLFKPFYYYYSAVILPQLLRSFDATKQFSFQTPKDVSEAPEVYIYICKRSY